MADSKRYYYLKLKEGFFESDEIKILESMKDGYIYSNILLKLYLKSLRNEGRLMYRNVIPYTPEILSTLVGHPVGVVEKSLEIFEKLGLTETLDNGAIYMMDIQNFIGKSSTEADRQRAYYNKVQTEKIQLEGAQVPVTEITEANQEVPKEEKPEEPKSKSEDTMQLFQRLVPEYDIPESVKGKLKLWIQYKMERKEPYKEQGMKSLLRKVEKQSRTYGENAVCELIEDCMGNTWKGIIWDKLAQRSAKPSNKANRGNERNYDYDALEREILRKGVK
jgi:predicted phage replisome organizer